MGTCDAINNRQQENEEYINIRDNNYHLNQDQRRQRLFSDPTSNISYSEMLQPLRRHTNHKNSHDYTPTYNSINNYNNNDQINLRVSHNYMSQINSINNISNNNINHNNSSTRNDYLSQRKFSDSYCNAFRQNYMSSGQNGLLRHLTETLDRVQELSESDWKSTL